MPFHTQQTAAETPFQTLLSYIVSLQLTVLGGTTSKLM
jgi:hypothetical protein